MKVDVGLEMNLAFALQIHGDEYHALLFIKDAKGFQCLDNNFFFMHEFCLYIDKVEMVFMLQKLSHRLYG
jgi:hypothetical protein